MPELIPILANSDFQYRVSQCQIQLSGPSNAADSTTFARRVLISVMPFRQRG